MEVDKYDSHDVINALVHKHTKLQFDVRDDIQFFNESAHRQICSWWYDSYEAYQRD